jgi:hypothetical protein
MTNINSIIQIQPGSAGTAAETVIATLPGVVVGPGAPLGVFIRGYISFLYGTGATQLTLRCRQSSLTGPLVDQPVVQTNPAGASEAMPFSFNDTSTVDLSNDVYVITAQFNGTAASSINSGEITVEV